MNFQKVLIAVDSSVIAMKAAKVAFDLAHQVNAEIAIVYVIDEIKVMGNIDAGISPVEADILLRKQANKTIEQLIRLYGNSKEPMYFIPEGPPVDEILAVAKQWGADVIVMGTHGRTGLAHLFAGSIAEDVVHHAKIPVLVVPHNVE